MSYSEVTIGNQIWMAQNLAESKFRNGEPIPQATTDEEWLQAVENQKPAWCYYDNDPANGAKYGKLYNWYAVTDSRGLAPEGWHVPTADECITLTSFSGVSLGYYNDESSVKQKAKTGWENNPDGKLATETIAAAFLDCREVFATTIIKSKKLADFLRPAIMPFGGFLMRYPMS